MAHLPDPDPTVRPVARPLASATPAPGVSEVAGWGVLVWLAVLFIPMAVMIFLLLW